MAIDLYVSWNEDTETWCVGIADDSSESGWSHGRGYTLTNAYEDLRDFLGYDPRDGK